MNGSLIRPEAGGPRTEESRRVGMQNDGSATSPGLEDPLKLQDIPAEKQDKTEVVIPAEKTEVPTFPNGGLRGGSTLIAIATPPDCCSVTAICEQYLLPLPHLAWLAALGSWVVALVSFG